MDKSIKDIWIESEKTGPVIGGHEFTDDNSDVIVTLGDNSKYVATFFTFDNINTLRTKNQKTGECLGGKFFWASDMLLIDKIERKEITDVIDELIRTKEFELIFKRVE